MRRPAKMEQWERAKEAADDVLENWSRVENGLDELLQRLEEANEVDTDQ